MRLIYEAAQNSDMTEGKGAMVGFAYFTSEDEAVLAVKGRGVMGVGDGEVFAIRLYDTCAEYDEQTAREKQIMRDTGTRYIERRKKVYGYRKDLAGQWGSGYVDNRDAPVNDPDFQQYLALKAKFEGPGA